MKLVVENIKFKIPRWRTVFNFSWKISVFAELGTLFGTFIKFLYFFLMCPRNPREWAREARESNPRYWTLYEKRMSATYIYIAVTLLGCQHTWMWRKSNGIFLLRPPQPPHHICTLKVLGNLKSPILAIEAE